MRTPKVHYVVSFCWLYHILPFFLLPFFRETTTTSIAVDKQRTFLRSWNTYTRCRRLTKPKLRVATLPLSVIDYGLIPRSWWSSRKKSIQTNRDKSDVLRHIIKNVSKRLFRLIESRALVTQKDFFLKMEKRLFFAREWRCKRVMEVQTMYKLKRWNALFASCRSWLFWHPYVQWVTRGEGVRFLFRARDGKSMATVIRNKSQQSASPTGTPRSSHACRSC
jgi:hypothetical protein